LLFFLPTLLLGSVPFMKQVLENNFLCNHIRSFLVETDRVIKHAIPIDSVENIADRFMQIGLIDVFNDFDRDFDHYESMILLEKLLVEVPTGSYANAIKCAVITINDSTAESVSSLLANIQRRNLQLLTFVQIEVNREYQLLAEVVDCLNSLNVEISEIKLSSHPIRLIPETFFVRALKITSWSDVETFHDLELLENYSDKIVEFNISLKMGSKEMEHLHTLKRNIKASGKSFPSVVENGFLLCQLFMDRENLTLRKFIVEVADRILYFDFRNLDLSDELFDNQILGKIENLTFDDSQKNLNEFLSKANPVKLTVLKSETGFSSSKTNKKIMIPATFNRLTTLKIQGCNISTSLLKVKVKNLSMFDCEQYPSELAIDNVEELTLTGIKFVDLTMMHKNLKNLNKLVLNNVTTVKLPFHLPKSLKVLEINESAKVLGEFSIKSKKFSLSCTQQVLLNHVRLSENLENFRLKLFGPNKLSDRLLHELTDRLTKSSIQFYLD